MRAGGGRAAAARPHVGFQGSSLRGGGRGGAARAAAAFPRGPPAVQHLPGHLQPPAQLQRQRLRTELQDHGRAEAEPGRRTVGGFGPHRRPPPTSQQPPVTPGARQQVHVARRTAGEQVPVVAGEPGQQIPVVGVVLRPGK